MPRPIARAYMGDTGHRSDALGSWDHGLEAYDIGDWAEDPKVESVQEFAKSSLTLAKNALTTSIKRNCESSLVKEYRAQEDSDEITSDKEAAAKHASEMDGFEERALYNIIH
eukprot:252025_1